MEQVAEARDQLSRLTLKQREVLDLVLQHQSSKQIAKALGISPYTVDQRIAAARARLGVATRGEVARTYGKLLEVCGETACGYPQVDSGSISMDQPYQVDEQEAVFSLSDAGAINVPAPWEKSTFPRTSLEALDTRFGMVGRLGIIVALAALTAMMFLTLVAIAQVLSAMFER